MVTPIEFIERFDRYNAIVLLEGKRNVPDIDQEKLTQLGKLLASKTHKMTFRSGNADGADYYFSLGVASVYNTRLQVIIPYTGHRQKANLAYETVALDEINIANEPEVIYQSKENKKTEKQIDRYYSLIDEIIEKRNPVNKKEISASFVMNWVNSNL